MNQAESSSFNFAFLHQVQFSLLRPRLLTALLSSAQIPTSNLIHDGEDFPEFELFDDIAVEGGPRSYAPAAGALSVTGLDMCQSINKPNHFSTPYDTGNLVVRRGWEFVVQVTFSRQLMPTDDFQMEFLIGSNPSPSRRSLLVVTFRGGTTGGWTGRIVEQRGATVLLGVVPSANAIVGKYRAYVAIVTSAGLQRTRRDATTDLYLLFNAWCPEDEVYFPEEQGRREYVLKDYGVIFQGSADATSSRNWMFGQFERGILDACIYILDASRMPIGNRGSALKLVRKGSAMFNSQDDNGVLVGNWSDDFSGGTPPTLWTGSVKILLRYANTGVPVSFAQCWVFAGVFNTFLRCLGVPSRVITNFNSAHDNTGNLKTDLIFKPDGAPDRRRTRDSIWNYHCWNEVFMVRVDLPPHLSGWQAVDATPQETSDGHFRCGPASVNAIKEGSVCHPFDAGFVFAEVNSDVVFWKRDRYGNMETFRVDKTHVGRIICTQAVGSTGAQDITSLYKHPEGSAQDQQTMAQAEQYGCERDHSEVAEPNISVVISSEQVTGHRSVSWPGVEVDAGRLGSGDAQSPGLGGDRGAARGHVSVPLGQDVNLALVFRNAGDKSRTVQGNLSSSIIFYTGVTSAHLKEQPFSITVPAYQTEQVLLKVSAQEYLSQLGSQRSLCFTVCGQADQDTVSYVKVVHLQVPALTLTVSGRPRVNQEMFVTVSFTNPLTFPLQQVHLAVEGAGLLSAKTRYYNVVEPLASLSWKESFIPRLPGQRRLGALLDCQQLREVGGTVDVTIEA
ncbi:coagulation factor XIII A chain-like [Synchiropus splendidus]|uniref:coagulation factor XIII A chain-like n=1 Tax=Synchiropus splendidus TaxID=270530 RepID=UPI00237DD67C|nr:coagulation factor XIII A chain-like [Synchiropus splendidus]